VSVNPSAGFSIVTYTGNGLANQTVGHGLGVTPAFVLVKARSSTNDWVVHHQSFTVHADQYMILNTTAAAATATNWFSKTSSTIGFPTAYGTTNFNGQPQVLYCWAEIAGFSKFGFYTGNGSADGTFVYLGFKPKFILYKATNTSGTGWVLWDTMRDSYNIVGNYLYANLSQAENYAAILDIVSNGFKLRSPSNGNNASGESIIYAAFAENPFRNALAR
jgi:hypothetical protein